MPEVTEDEVKIDETVPGGRYIRGDQVVNAEGVVLEGLSVKDGEIVGTEKAAGAEPMAEPKKGK